MNSLQLELDSINSQLELLTYRKTQLDSIMAEYSDVVNRVKSLVLSMEDANVEPSNLLMEIEGIIHGEPNPTPEELPTETEPTPELEPTEEPTAEEQEPTAEPTPEPFTFDISLYPKLNALGLPVQTEAEPESKPEHIKRYPNNIYWDNGSGVRVFVPKKRRYKLELEAIAKDCIEQGYSSKFEIVECDGDWLTMFSNVTLESSVQGIINNFYPKHTDGETTPEQNPEPVKLMACVPTVAISPTPTPTPKTRLNDQAYRRGDTLLIGFTNKRLLNSWEKWIKTSWGDSVKTWSDEQLDGFTHCLSVLWYGSSSFIDWERLSSLNYSLKPDEQPTAIKLDDVRDVILTLQNSGVKFISKGELLAHHLNSLKASDLEGYLEKLAEEGLIILGNKSIDLCVKPSEQKQDNPTFEYTEVDSKTTKIYNNGMLLGIAKNCGTHWESPQFPGQTFPNRRDVVAALWELVNKF
ncbi:hypothetical protein [Planktothrix sp. FACHB-1365]|uniref:hypothetical protein n=1 Tax=Planktothrix sp. FACHB-1365 TaxID=2692855 RepID=UPI001689BC93|nr:hypothetical protein [Planktothrix sp. FACHB-1365]MBD2485832.1 hypothetical protein [Planktothrix sp. FACHB-1365]